MQRYPHHYLFYHILKPKSRFMFTNNRIYKKTVSTAIRIYHIFPLIPSEKILYLRYNFSIPSYLVTLNEMIEFLFILLTSLILLSFKNLIFSLESCPLPDKTDLSIFFYICLPKTCLIGFLIILPTLHSHQLLLKQVFLRSFYSQQHVFQYNHSFCL